MHYNFGITLYLGEKENKNDFLNTLYNERTRRVHDARTPPRSSNGN